MKKRAMIMLILASIFLLGISGCQKSCTSGNLSMSIDEARQIASQSECSQGNLEENFVCNSITKTIWIDLDIEKEGCSPACVIEMAEKNASINWRCTGLIVPK